jgi:hypothetical protein
MKSHDPEAPASPGETSGPDPVSGAPAAPAIEPHTLALAHGHSLVVEGGQERNLLQLVDAGGVAHLEISIGPEGIRLLVRGAGLSLATTGSLAIEADRLSLHGKSGISLTTDGDARIEAGGRLESSGRSQHIRAARGDVRIHANDDVQIEGERIRLGS